MVVRWLANVVVSVWVCLVAGLRALLGRRKGKGVSPEPSRTHSQWGGGAGEGEGGEWDNWDSVEPFSVHVVPSDGEPLPPANADQSDEVQDVDLFQDMQPVIKKPKKVRLAPSHNHLHSSGSSSHTFAVDSTFHPESADLEEWTESGPSWEEETELDQGDLLQQSQEVLREKRREERERRKMQQELLRNQRAHLVQQTGHHGLGTRVN